MWKDRMDARAWVPTPNADVHRHGRQLNLQCPSIAITEADETAKTVDGEWS